MQVRYDIAEAGQIDLVRLHDRPHGSFGGDYDIQQMLALSNCQVGHFLNMAMPDHPAKAWKGRAFNAADTDNTATVILPKDRAAG